MPDTGQQSQPHVFHKISAEDYEHRLATDAEFAASEEARLNPDPHGDEVKQRRKQAVDKAADSEDGSDLTEQEAQDGADWFTSDEEEEEGYLDFDLNVASKGERWVRFRVQALQRKEIDLIRKQNTVEKPDGTRETNELDANVRIAVEGLIVPDLRKPEMRKVRGQSYMDPADALEARFAHKPGLVDQITGKVIDVSGYGDGDLREVRAGTR
jgi:hypothetical protein